MSRILFVAAAVSAVVFLSAAITSLIATRRKRPLLERRSGDVAFINFFLAQSLTLAAVSGSLMILAGAILFVIVMTIAGFATRPRCPRCGEGVNLLTNRGRRPRCLFCDSPLA